MYASNSFYERNVFSKTPEASMAHFTCQPLLRVDLRPAPLPQSTRMLIYTVCIHVKVNKTVTKITWKCNKSRLLLPAINSYALFWGQLMRISVCQIIG